MNIAMILIGVLIFLSFPFICMMPVPVIAIVLILLGLKAFI